MKDEYKSLLHHVNKKSTYKDFLKNIKKDKKYFAKLKEINEEAIQAINCLDCGNCCRLITPVLRQEDVTEIKKNLKVSAKILHSEYLVEDDEKAERFNFISKPCPFLDLEDNHCRIYEYRPKACEDYPHIGARAQIKNTQEIYNNMTICPIVAWSLYKLKEGTNFFEVN